MRTTFTEKFIQALKCDSGSDRKEIWDVLCPYLGCRVSESGNKTYFVKKRFKGRTIRATLGKTSEISVAFARKKASEYLEKINNGINPTDNKREVNNEITLDELFEEYMERHAVNQNCERYRKDCASLYRRNLSQWKNRRLSELDMRTIEMYIAALRKTDGISAANSTLTLLRHMYNKAIRWGWQGRNPTHGIPKYKLAARERFLSPEELQRFLFVLDNRIELRYRVLFYTLLYTGQRCGNVLSMRWEDVNFSTNIWHIPRTKNGTSMRVPLVDQLSVMLKELKLQTLSECVFPSPNDPTKPLFSPRKIWNKIKEEADLQDVRIHDLRRTVASYECMNGVNLSVVSKTLNHKTLPATQVYVWVDTSAVAQALQSTVNLFERFK